MFKILTKGMNIDELRAITKLWGRLVEMFESEFCDMHHEDCKYKRLCRALYSTEEYLVKTLAKREKELEEVSDERS